MLPGRSLHRLAALICSPKTLEQIVEPAIADLQKEYLEADAIGAVQRLRTRIAGYTAILRVIAMCAFSVSTAAESDRQAIVQTMAWSFTLMMAFTALLMLPPLFLVDVSLSSIHLVPLIPQAVPLAIPIGLTFGVALGMAGRTVTPEVTRVILLSALVASIVSFGTLAWVMPAGNQAFRESVVQKGGEAVHLTKGAAEMTLSELDRQTAIAAAAGDSLRSGVYAWSFHLRFALSVAAIVLAGVLLATSVTRRAARILVALLACVAYWALMYAGEALAIFSSSGPGYYRAGTIPIVVGAWLPNIVLVAAALLIASSRSSRLRGPKAVAS